MTYTSDNIVGVEFTDTKGENWEIEEVFDTGTVFIVRKEADEWHVNIKYHYTEVCNHLNNGTWIVKNSKV